MHVHRVFLLYIAAITDSDIILGLVHSGYMSPEYAMSGHFSVKSDVFSFGVLVLEIISGRKSSGFYHAENDLNLLGYVSANANLT